MSFPKQALSYLLFSCFLIWGCTNDPNELEKKGGIGNSCGPADGPEVWLRISDVNPAACPSALSSPPYGLRIRLIAEQTILPPAVNGRLEKLQTGTYSNLEVLSCEEAWPCGPKAEVEITNINDTSVAGFYQLSDSSGMKIGTKQGFRASKCATPPWLCG